MGDQANSRRAGRRSVFSVTNGVLRQAMTSARRLLRSPVFSAAIVLTIGVGIGANTAIFSLVKAILLDPLPYPQPDRLVSVQNQASARGNEILGQAPAVHFTYEQHASQFEGFGLWRGFEVDVRVGEEPVRISAVAVTAGTLPALRTRPALGRLFTQEDDSPGTPLTVILSHSRWQSQFGGDPGVIGRALEVNGRSHEVIGVLPRGIHLPDADPSLYLPLRFDLSTLTVQNFVFSSCARLRPGVAIEEATADLARLLPAAVEQFPGGLTLEFLEEAKAAPLLRPLKDVVVGDVGTLLWVLLGSAGIILLTACADVANLFLLRAEDRQRELAVRCAMGAGGSRIAGEFLMESLLLTLLGGAVGLVLAVAGVRLLVTWAPVDIPRLDVVAVDSTVLFFALGLSLLSGLVFGLAPLGRWRWQNMAEVLREASRGGGSGRGGQRARNVLVVAQIAMALVLLVGAGLMVRSFQAIRATDPGFATPEEVVALSVTVRTADAADPEAVISAHERISQKLAEIPGVRAVGLSTSITMDGAGGFDPIHVEDFPLPDGQIPPLRRFKWIGGGYFEAMGNPIVAGRSLTWADIHDRARVVLITENLAREVWGDPEQAIGRRIGTGQVPGNWREIIGVVGDVRDDGVARDPVAIVYWPMVIDGYWAEMRGNAPFVARTMRHVIRSPRVGTDGFLDEVKAAVRTVVPGESLTRSWLLSDLLRRSMARTAFVLVLLAIASLVALLLAVVGVSGAISYAVSRRTREIGVRMALGAQPSAVAGMVLRQGLLYAAVGISLGLGVAFGLTRMMRGLLVGVAPLDVLTFITVAIGLTAIALGASYVPARRAASVNPVIALRE